MIARLLVVAVLAMAGCRQTPDTGTSAEKSKPRAEKAKSRAPAAAKSGAGRDRLSALLLSSAWCSFSYNQISGASHQERFVFRPGGSWDSGARGESYSSGAYGSVAGQSDSAAGGRWEVRGGRLLMAERGGTLQDIGLTVTANSNGYPILRSSGKEYSSCR